MNAKTDSGTLNLTIQAKDERYPIDVIINENEKFTLYFNPGDIFVMRYVNNLTNASVGSAGDTEEILNYADILEKNLDAIFGEGAARQVCRYDGAEHILLNALVEKVKEGYADFKEKAKTKESENKKRSANDAKSEAESFIAHETT